MAQYIISPLNRPGVDPNSPGFNQSVCMVQQASKNDLEGYKQYKPSKRGHHVYRSIDPAALNYWVDIVHGYIMSTKSIDSKYFPVFFKED